MQERALCDFEPFNPTNGEGSMPCDQVYIGGLKLEREPVELRLWLQQSSTCETQAVVQ